MRRNLLILRNLTYFWRTNLAVVLGVAAAVSVLSGALVVGDSMRESLRALVLNRIGRTDYVISSLSFFEETLGQRLQQVPIFNDSFSDACPILVEQGTLTHQTNRRREGNVHVYGIDERFWEFHGRPLPSGFDLHGRNVLLGFPLANELHANPGDTLLLHVATPLDIPLESLHGRKDQGWQTIRVTVVGVLPEDWLGSFALRPNQEQAYTLFVSLPFLQIELDRKNQINALLIAEKHSLQQVHSSTSSINADNLRMALGESLAFSDMGLSLKTVAPEGYLTLESRSTLLGEDQVSAAGEIATSMGVAASPILTYLANALTFKDRQIPYSLVSGVDGAFLEKLLSNSGSTGVTEIQKTWNSFSSNNEANDTNPPVSVPPILLNAWAGDDLGVSQGNTIGLEYYIWQPGGFLETRKRDFVVRGILPLQGGALDRDLAPTYPGITDTESLSDWDPPFPLDLAKIRPKDEEYWKRFKTSPKAFIPLALATQLWGSRYGRYTSVRFYFPNSNSPPAESQTKGSTLSQESSQLLGNRLRSQYVKKLPGFSLWPLRQEGIQASQGATDFGAYFTYFSFFLVMSSIALAGLFFRFGIEQRVREIGLLRAVGFSTGQIRGLFLIEGTFISLFGGVLGLFGAWGFGRIVVHGLSTWWIGAVHTRELSVHITAFSLLMGLLGGFTSSMIVIGFTLQKLGLASPRALFSGNWFTQTNQTLRKPQTYFTYSAASLRDFGGSRLFPMAVGSLALPLLVASSLGVANPTLSFFGAGIILLLATLLALRYWLRSSRRPAIDSRLSWALAQLGFRNLAYRSGRSLFTIALMASATFIVVAVDAFRHTSPTPSSEKHSSTGGLSLMAESLSPIVYDLNRPAGRKAMNLDGLNLPEHCQTKIFHFRLRPGDDASCLNLYQPREPRILGVPMAFIEEARFSFQSSLASNPDEKANPWVLLSRIFPDGAIPAIVDATTLNYSLHLSLGQDVLMPNADGGSIRFRIVGALADSLFQSELLISETNFMKVFPRIQGYRFFLIDTPPERRSSLTEYFERQLLDFGMDVHDTVDRIAAYHQVENTYLSTFQSLGSLGLLLGSFGLVAVLLRNVAESRRQLALLRATGYTSRHLTIMVSIENILLLVLGLGVGTVCAWIAIIPAILAHGGRFPTHFLVWFLPAVIGAGTLASLYAASTALRIPLVNVLKSE